MECVWLDLQGPLYETALRQSLQQLIDRHEALRIGIDAMGTHQHIWPQVNLALPLIDLTDVPPQAQEAEIQRWLQAEQQRPFDLAQPPLLRVHLLKRADQHHGLVLTVHHIVVDGWSIQVLLTELSQLYNAAVRGTAVALPLPGAYRDYVRQAGQGSPSDAAYWQQWPLPQWQLPTKQDRPPSPTYAGACQAWHLPPDRYRALQAWSRQQGCTPFMALLAGFCLLLHRWSQASDLMVGISVAGQGQADWSRLVAHSVHVLPVHSQLRPQSLTDYLHSIRSRLLGCYDHADYSLSQRVRQAKGRSHAPAGHPLQPVVPVLFNLDPSMTVPAFDQLAVACRPQIPPYVRWDLTWHLSEAEGGLHLNALYRTALFEATTVDSWVAQYDTMLALMMEQSHLTLEELHQALEEKLDKQTQQVQAAMMQHNRQKLATSRRQSG